MQIDRFCALAPVAARTGSPFAKRLGQSIAALHDLADADYEVGPAGERDGTSTWAAAICRGVCAWPGHRQHERLDVAGLAHRTGRDRLDGLAWLSVSERSCRPVAAGGPRRGELRDVWICGMLAGRVGHVPGLL